MITIYMFKIRRFWLVKNKMGTQVRKRNGNGRCKIRAVAALANDCMMMNKHIYIGV